jgi:hypothetical protein
MKRSDFDPHQGLRCCAQARDAIRLGDTFSMSMVASPQPGISQAPRQSADKVTAVEQQDLALSVCNL